MTTSEQINEVAAALATAQGEFPQIIKTSTATVTGRDGRQGYSYKYADIADVLKQILPVLAKHKLAVIQPTVIDGSGLFIKTRLVHASGQWIESEYPVCSVNGDHQKMGGAMTYARRYALCSLIGVAADEDTDGQEAAEPQPKQIKRPQNVRELPPKAAKAANAKHAVDAGDLVGMIHDSKGEADLQAVTNDPHNIRVFEAATPEDQDKISNAITAQRGAFDYLAKRNPVMAG